MSSEAFESIIDCCIDPLLWLGELYLINYLLNIVTYLQIILTFASSTSIYFTIFSALGSFCLNFGSEVKFINKTYLVLVLRLRLLLYKLIFNIYACFLCLENATCILFIGRMDSLVFYCPQKLSY